MCVIKVTLESGKISIVQRACPHRILENYPSEQAYHFNCGLECSFTTSLIISHPGSLTPSEAQVSISDEMGEVIYRPAVITVEEDKTLVAYVPEGVAPPGVIMEEVVKQVLL